MFKESGLISQLQEKKCVNEKEKLISLTKCGVWEFTLKIRTISGTKQWALYLRGHVREPSLKNVFYFRDNNILLAQLLSFNKPYNEIMVIIWKTVNESNSKGRQETKRIFLGNIPSPPKKDQKKLPISSWRAPER